MASEAKPTAATMWLQTCSGCHMALLDLHEQLLDVLARIDLRYSPLVDTKEIPEVDLALVEGGVGNEEEAALVRELRDKSGTLLAFGSCACFGGLPGLRNLFDREEVLQRAFRDTVTDGSALERHDETVPPLLPLVRPVTDLVEVDYMVPGCPSRPDLLGDALMKALGGEKSVTPTKNLCAECPREQKAMHTPRREFLTGSVCAVFELENIDPDKCFLEQGVVCMGPATRAGCEGRCVNANMPCRGCNGPPPEALEQGGKMVDSLASILPVGAMMFAEDTVGTGYRFTLPISIMPGPQERSKG